ncbi:prepilin-type N-terminal cleavage/methylation domain-containing protein [Pseudidiomarina sediminum]|uniref:prepilin-type N-terminal cleavage/methylation domain-containing protein n=1 Tax=Pseudidiomarina sediminum TaxID=431675 RepID=UPI001C9875F0|nr:prepilin-type N-terminal cleavage/methylation domain-containing protein [Pseudidiomarina sediminum]MBY6063936.1 prepilin-type N-terminal cleavage/methylation domain-containing protein [Pseudidiomarina sediminum]
MRQTRFTQARGFTLIEVIVVIVILGILGIASFSFLSFGSEIFRDASSRQQIIAESRFALDRLAKELKYVVPRSIRVDAADQNRCIEFVPLVTSSRYLELPQGGPASPTEFIAIAPQQVSALSTMFLFVYPTQTAHVYAASSRRQQIQTATALTGAQSGLMRFTFQGSAPTFSQHSPGRRYFIGAGPVSWCYDDSAQALVRFTGYNLSATQPSLTTLTSSATPREVMLATLINDLASEPWPFTIMPASLRRNSLVQTDWIVGDRLGEKVQLTHEIHLPNVP